VGELLSGYIDGELTQQQQQRVRIHCEACAECAHELEQLEKIRREVGKSRLSPISEDSWREHMKDPTVEMTRGLGWILFIAGVLGISGIAVYEFVIDTSMATHIKVITGLVWVGMGALLVSVLRQRLIERKSDKYKDVEI
jgi:ferric-dicitrate binding protein FerR (iron transport regulator)